ncbi:MAG: lactate racemase [Clostridia bacterium]|jgi:nickel-dependent lactate racemase|nr:lactate racemase [Clostridia bacterium]
MYETFKLKYGDKYLELNLPKQNIYRVLQSKEIESITDMEKEVNNCLDNPIGSKPFNQLFVKGDKIVIVASDITRLWIKLDQFLPFIVERLNKLGIPDKDIIVLIATGTHREETPEEKMKIVGKEMYDRLEVIDHNCDTSKMVYLGKTPRGTEVEINKLLVERKVILTGGIVHHLMAGFGGGRKSIVPGVASRKTIAQNHLHALDPEAERSNPLIGVGTTNTNPLHLDMIDCTKLVEPEFLINAVIDSKGNIAKLFCGHWLKAWEEGCKWADEKYGVPLDEKADLVIVSCGGYPKDISLYQSTKTLFNAALAVKPGGTILLLAECREGAGADAFFSWSKHLKEGKLDPELRKNFTIPGYIFYAAVEVAQKTQVVLCSTIEPSLVNPMGIIPANTLDEALKVIDINKNNQKIIVMPYGGNTVPLITV